MPSVNDGLSLGDEDVPDPTDVSDDFAVSLAAKLGQVAAPETPVEEPAPTETPAAERGPDGRFLPKETPATEEGTLSPDQVRLAEQEAMIGRQSAEVGEARKREEALLARIEALEKAEVQPSAPNVPTYISEEQAEGVVERVGGRGAIMAVANDLADPDGQVFSTVYAAAVNAAEDQAEIADLVELRILYRQHYAEQLEPETTEAPETEDPAVAWAREQHAAAQAKEVVSQIKAVTPDFEALAPHFPKALELAPNLHADIQSGDPDKLKVALGQLLLVARGVQVTVDATPTAPVLTPEQQVASQVAQGSLRLPVGVGAPQEGSKEADTIAAFKAALRETVSPSVTDGLTIG